MGLRGIPQSILDKAREYSKKVDETYAENSGDAMHGIITGNAANEAYLQCWLDEQSSATLSQKPIDQELIKSKKEYIAEGLVRMGNCKDKEEAMLVVERMGFEEQTWNVEDAITTYSDALWAAITAMEEKEAHTVASTGVSDKVYTEADMYLAIHYICDTTRNDGMVGGNIRFKELYSHFANNREKILQWEQRKK